MYRKTTFVCAFVIISNQYMYNSKLLKKKTKLLPIVILYLHFKIQIYPICTCLYYILIKLKTIICVNISISMFGIVLSARWIILGTNLRNLSKDFR